LKRRSFLDSPGIKNRIPIASPLLPNRSMNNLPEISRSIKENNSTFTPAMPARTSGLGFNNEGQIQMNKIIRKDISAKPPIDKPKLIKESQKNLAVGPIKSENIEETKANKQMHIELSKDRTRKYSYEFDVESNENAKKDQADNKKKDKSSKNVPQLNLMKESTIPLKREIS